MRSTFKVLFYVNGSKEKDGMVPIMGRITVNWSVAQFSCRRVIHLRSDSRKMRLSRNTVFSMSPFWHT